MDINQIFFPGSFCEIRPKWFSNVFNLSTGKGIKIGVVDSGWDYSLIDCRIKEGVGLINPENELLLCVSNNYNDVNGHGTSCIDLILRIAPNVEIYPIKVFGKKLETSIDILCEAIRWAVKEEIKILNFSLGTILKDFIEPFYLACEYAIRNGIIIIAANTNEKGLYSCPAIFENSIGVKFEEKCKIYDFHFYDNEAIECAANGSYNNLCSLGGERITSIGNSYAAPIITGIVALILENNPDYKLPDVRRDLSRISSILKEYRNNPIVIV
jgi:subtilisin family serine protease